MRDPEFVAYHGPHTTYQFNRRKCRQQIKKKKITLVQGSFLGVILKLTQVHKYIKTTDTKKVTLATRNTTCTPKKDGTINTKKNGRRSGN